MFEFACHEGQLRDARHPERRSGPGTGGRRQPLSGSSAGVHFRGMKLKPAVALYVAATLVCAVTVAAQRTSAPTQSRELSAAGKAALTQQLSDSVHRGDAPGIAALVVDREGVLFEGAAGQLDIAKGTPMPANAIFYIASMTKPVTSVAIMMLMEAGQAEARRSGVEVSRRLRQAAGDRQVQRAGRDVRDASGEEGDDDPPAAGAHLRHRLFVHQSDRRSRWSRRHRRASGSCRCSTSRATKWNYSASTRVLGFIVEKVTGRRSSTGIRSTSSSRSAWSTRRCGGAEQAVACRRAVHARERQDRAAAGAADPVDADAAVPWRRRPVLHGPGLRHVRAHAAERRHAGPVRILSPASVKMMGENQIGAFRRAPAGCEPARTKPFPLGAGKDKFGLGFQIAANDPATTGYRSPGSLSWAGIFNTEFWIDPGAADRRRPDDAAAARSTTRARFARCADSRKPVCNHIP